MVDRSFRNFVLQLWTDQINAGDAELDIEGAVRAVLENEELTRGAVRFAVGNVRHSVANKLIRKRVVREDTGGPRPGGAASRFVAAIVNYGLSLLDVTFGEKRLGDYLPGEALTYASQQHEMARTVGIQARFVASVAKACPDEHKLIREQITAERVEAIRRVVIDSSPNKEAALMALDAA